MRQSNPTFIDNDESKIAAVILEPSFCAEQEWGISKLERTLGIDQTNLVFEALTPEQPLGILRRKVTKTQMVRFQHVPENRNTFGQWMLACSPCWALNESKTPEEYVHSRGYDGVNVAFNKAKSKKANKLYGRDIEHTAVWDDEGFCVITKSPKEGKFLEDLYEAMVARQAAVQLGGGNAAFGRPGLVLAILDRIDKKNLDDSAQAEKEGLEVAMLARQSGIYDLIPKSKYFALKPRKLKPSEEATTAFPIVFWLNPCDQQNHNFGWYTVEQLKEWHEGRGPVMIKKD